MSTLQYIEAHATSTSLGDATELNALGEVLWPTSSRRARRFPSPASKPTSATRWKRPASAGVIKTVLCMQHRTFPPAINIQSLNPKIDWDTAPFYIPRKPAPGPSSPTACRAAPASMPSASAA